MKSLIVILVGLYFSWQYTDLESTSWLNSILAPLGVFIFLVSFCLWLVLIAGFDRRTDNRHHYSGSGYDGGGDGGGGADGGI